MQNILICGATGFIGRNLLEFYLKKNRGTAYCRNLGLKKTKAKFIAFIDSDDLWSRNKLKTQIYFMNKNNYEFTYSYYETFNENGITLNKILTFFDILSLISLW